MIGDIITELISNSTTLLGSLGSVFDSVIDLVYTAGALSNLGLIIVGTAGFALAWSGVRFVFGFVNRLLNKSRAGR